MTLFLGILLAFLVFLIVVLVHEFGHFSIARLTGMKVLEFGFGLPPKMLSMYKDKAGTEYTWNWLPIGGFVRILGEDPTGEDAQKEGAFMTRPWLARVLVLVAGVTMNFILAFLIFTGLALYGTKPITVNPLLDTATNSFFLPSFDEAIEMGYITYDGIAISSITGSLAESIGIGQDEQVLKIDGIPILQPQDLVTQIQAGDTVEMTLIKNGVTRDIQITPIDGKIGVQVYYNNITIDQEYEKKLGLLDALYFGVHETYASSIMTFSFLATMLDGIFAPENPQEREEAKNMLSGPIGVGAVFVGLVEISAPVGLILIITALISINLGVINLLPIPALDGGRIVTTTLYSLVVRYFHNGTDRFLQFEKYYHAVGFILLMILTLYIAGLDIARFI